MKGTFVRTGVVVAVLAGLGSYAWFVEMPKPQTSGAEKPKEKLFAGLDHNKVESVSLKPRSGEALRVVKQSNAWRLVEPSQAPADASAVEALVGSLESAEIEDVAAEAGASLAEFGLETPQNLIELKVAGQPAPLQLMIGDKVPASNAVYARVLSRNRVVTIPGYVASGLEKKPFDLRDRDLLKIRRDAVRSLSVEGPEGGYTLTRKGSEWAVTAPLKTRASRFGVDGLLGTLESLRMDRIASEDAKDLKPFGLDQPARKLTLTLADGSTRVLELGSSPEDKKIHARVASQSLVAVVPSALQDDLQKGLSNWRAKRLLELATYDVTRIEVDANGSKRVLDRRTEKGKEGFDESKWKRSSPDAKEVEAKTVEDALFKLGGTEASEFLDQPADPASFGLAPTPRLKLLLKLDKGTPVWLELGEKGGAWFARRPDDDSILKLDPAKADELLKAFSSL